MANSHFTVAVHILAVLDNYRHPGDEPPTSEVIAESVNTNPVFIRRILAKLRRAGLVTSKPGVKGGISLARDAEEITLRDVFKAANDSNLLPLHAAIPNKSCPIGGGIGMALKPLYDEAEGAMEDVLDRTTIKQVGNSCMDSYRLRIGFKHSRWQDDHS